QMNGTVTKLTTASPVGINETFNFQNLNLFPNPSIDKLSIQLSQFNTNSNCKISIYNLQGQLLLQEAIENINSEITVSEFPKGMYNLKIENSNGIIMKRFIKQ